VYEALEIVSSQACQKKIKLSAVIAHESQITLVQSILGDRRRYLQFLVNFLSNSLKFTPAEGKITVFLEVLEHQEQLVRMASSADPYKRRSSSICYSSPCELNQDVQMRRFSVSN